MSVGSDGCVHAQNGVQHAAHAVRHNRRMMENETLELSSDGARRIGGLDKQIRAAAMSSSLALMMEALISLDVLSAVTILAELGDITRFDHSQQMMSVLRLVSNTHCVRAL